MSSAILAEHFRIETACAIRTETVSELCLGTFADILLQGVPMIVRSPNFVTRAANGQKTLQSSYFRESPSQTCHIDRQDAEEDRGDESRDSTDNKMFLIKIWNGRMDKQIDEWVKIRHEYNNEDADEDSEANLIVKVEEGFVQAHTECTSKACVSRLSVVRCFGHCRVLVASIFILRYLPQTFANLRQQNNN